MKDKFPYWVAAICSIVAVVLVVVNVYLTLVVRTKQADLGQRQASIVSGQALAQLNQNLVRTLAESSIKNNDTQLRELLSGQGITMKAEPSEKK